MKPRLTAVLDLRRRAEDAARREVGRLERERLELVAARAALASALTEAADAPVPPVLREQFAAFRAATAQAIADGDARLAVHEHGIDAARVALAAAHRDVKAIEAVRARDARLHARVELRREGRLADEHAARIRLEATT